MPRIDLPLICLTILATPAIAEQRISSAIDYGAVIAPILSRHCLECHGPDAQQREGGLRLDSQKSAKGKLESGVRAIVPGKPSASELIARVTSTSDDRMPPSDHATALSPTEIEQLTHWIQQGAKWETHWAFDAPIRRSPPNVHNGKWIQNPIDQFILAKLEQESLAPRPAAAPRKLARRLYFDLTGLPPTPQQISDFLADDRPNAWERLVDRLLATPQYGQRWGRHWLDVARYGDSNGGDENHAYPLAWRYRDYVISSFNEDLPFDDFVHEQLAGDLLNGTANASLLNRPNSAKTKLSDQDYRKTARITATGFLAMGTKILAEQDEVKKQADIVDEQIDTVGKTFLALTLGCARCHDHKFDPVSIDDYYSMAAVFQGIEFGSRSPEFGPDHPRRQRGEALLKAIAGERKKLRGTGPWQEDWGGYREVHFGEAKYKAIRVNFKTPYVGVDEMELFGPDLKQGNVALASRGTKVSGPDHMAQRGRTTVSRINDGEYGTMAWRARAPNASKEKPWALLEFAEPQTVSFMRVSSNREYYYEVDYLERMPGMSFSHFKIEGQKPDGTWRTLADTHYIETINKERAVRAAPLERIQELIGEYAETGAAERRRPRRARTLSRAAQDSTFRGAFFSDSLRHRSRGWSPARPRRRRARRAGPVARRYRDAARDDDAPS